MPEQRARKYHQDRVAGTLRDEITAMIEGQLSDPRIAFAYVSQAHREAACARPQLSHRPLGEDEGAYRRAHGTQARRQEARAFRGGGSGRDAGGEIGIGGSAMACNGSLAAESDSLKPSMVALSHRVRSA
jgi:hypothetical protein